LRGRVDVENKLLSGVLCACFYESSEERTDYGEIQHFIQSASKEKRVRP